MSNFRLRLGSEGTLPVASPDPQTRKRRASPIHWLWRRKSSEERGKKFSLFGPFRPQNRSLSEVWSNKVGGPTENECNKAKRSATMMMSSEPGVPRIKKTLGPQLPFLDDDLAEPDSALRELRANHPRTFTNLIASYLSYIEFQTDDLFRIADDVGKEEALMAGRRKTGFFFSSAPSVSASANSPSSPGLRYLPGSPISKSIFTPIKGSNFLSNWSSIRASREEIAYWYRTVNVMINYLLDEGRYCKKFIFRRSGVQRLVNTLEKQLFCQKIMRTYENIPLSTSITAPSIILAENWQISQLLTTNDPIIVASTLGRILRRYGPLIPTRLHYLFGQLSKPEDVDIDIGLPARQVERTSSTYLNRCRALRLLLQIIPSYHLSLIFRPLFRLLALITMESVCEVNERSICVLFAPILLVDRTCTLPAELANPQLQEVVRLLLDLAKRDMIFDENAQTREFKVPRLFLHDCHSNLVAHKMEKDPPLQCSLRYCTTFMPKQSSGRKAEARPVNDLPASLRNPLISKSRPSRSRPKHSPNSRHPSPMLLPTPISDTTNLAAVETMSAVSKPRRVMSLKFPVKRSAPEQCPLKLIQIQTPPPLDRRLKH